MKNFKRIISLLVIILLLFTMCACAVRLPQPQEMSSADEASAMGFAEGTYESELAVGDYSFFDVKIKYDYKYAVEWSSANPEVASVDSAGRVDALSEGETVITAKARKAVVEYPVKVTKAKTQPLSNTTAITDNASTLEQNKLGEDNLNLYALLVNSAKGCVTAYTHNSNGVYNIPVRAMVCAVGEDMAKQNYRIESREDWVSDGKYYYQYASNFGFLRFSSTPFENQSADSLVTEEYNKLGEVCTDGNIWLSVEDAKWIYDNCPDTTLIKVSENAAVPLGVPKPLYLGENAKSRTWDPTDPHAKNPFAKLTPYFEGVEDTVISAGSTFNVLASVTAFDTCSNELGAKIKVDGSVSVEKEGTYILTYTCVDSFGRTGRADRVITVVSNTE